MPWENNSGNGGGSRGPWGQPPRGGGNNGQGGPKGPGGEPPDLEDLLQASRQRLKRAFPNGRGGRGGKGLDGKMFGLIGGLFLIVWLISGYYQVQPNELGVVTTFGKFEKVTSPGPNWHIPAPFQNAKVVAVTTNRDTQIPANRGQRNGLSEGLMLTGDKNIVDVELTVQWNVKVGADVAGEDGLPGAAQFVFNTDDPGNLVLTVGESAIREVVGRNTLDFIQTQGRSLVQEETQKLMQEALDAQNVGVQIASVNMEKADPPTTEVDEAFLDVEAAKQDKEQYVNTARAYANRVVPEARGQAQRILESARAYKAQVTAEARGQAERFNSILTEYQKAPEVTRQRMYLETVEGVLNDMNKIIVEDGAGSGVVPYLPLNELKKTGAQQ